MVKKEIKTVLPNNRWKKLSILERKLLHIMRLDARMTNTKMAKIIGTSREMVQYTKQKVERIGLLRGYSLDINYRIIGYISHVMFVKFSNWGSASIPGVLKSIYAVPGVAFFGYFFGKYEICIYFVSTNIVNMEKTLVSVQKILQPHAILQEHLIISKKYPRAYEFMLTEKEIKSLGPLPDFLQRSNVKKAYTLSGDEKKVLGFLHKKPTAPISHVAKSCNLSQVKARKIINTLYKNHVILGYVMVGQFSLMFVDNYNLFEVLLRFGDAHKKDEFEQFIAYNAPNIISVNRYMVGKYDFKINLYARHVSDLRNQLNTWNTKFGGVIQVDTVLLFGMDERDLQIRQITKERKNLFL